MKLRAIATPTDTPSAAPPPAMAADAATIVASIWELSSALMVTSPMLLTSELSSANAWAPPSITFCASAPAPLREIAATPPDSATETATETASMRASWLAVMVMSPLLAVTSASVMDALTELSIVLLASDTPMAMAAEKPPLRATATLAAAVTAWMLDWSTAVTDTLVPEMPRPASPSISADTCVVMRLSATAPAPLAPMAKRPPPAMATEPARMKASIDCSPEAATVTAPEALMPLSCAEALTCSGSSSTLSSCHRSASP